MLVHNMLHSLIGSKPYNTNTNNAFEYEAYHVVSIEAKQPFSKLAPNSINAPYILLQNVTLQPPQMSPLSRIHHGHEIKTRGPLAAQMPL